MTQTKKLATLGLVAPGRHIQERNRAIAIAYLSMGGKRGVIKKLSNDTGINIRTIQRAISRELAWAKAQPPEDLPQETHP